jgi:aspartate/methionine/tyrosine aminotransferase
MVLINPGDEILVPDPGYPAYASIVRICGGIPRPYRLEASAGFALDLKEVEKALSPGTKALILNNPHNPTGAVYGDEEVRRLAAVCEDRKIPIVSDEVYGAIYFRNPPASPAVYSKRVIVIDSLSKTFSMTGWRLGWCVLPPELMKPLAALHQLSVSCASALSQHAAIFALRGGADAEKKANLRELKRRRDLIMDALRRYTDLPFLEPAGAFYIMADVSAKANRFGDSFEIARNILAREKVVTIPGSAFGPGGEGYLRLSFAAGPDEIEEGVRRIGRFLS